jgi:hypothetical protein
LDLVTEYCAAIWDGMIAREERKAPEEQYLCHKTHCRLSLDLGDAEGNVNTVNNPYQASQDRDEDSEVFYRLETTHLVHLMSQDVGRGEPTPFWGWMTLEVAEASRRILRESLQGKKKKLGRLGTLH